MSSREALRKAIEEFNNHPDTDPDGCPIQFSEFLWRKAERLALERAAQVCEQLWTRAGDADQCTDAIRALMDQDASSEKEQNNG